MTIVRRRCAHSGQLTSRLSLYSFYSSPLSLPSLSFFSSLSSLFDTVMGWLVCISGSQTRRLGGNGRAHSGYLTSHLSFSSLSLHLSSLPSLSHLFAAVFCTKRKPIYYGKELHKAPLLHFHSLFKSTCLLLHFYAFVHFTDPKIRNYYKRIVRDHVRYSDKIFCAAGRIGRSLIE